MKTASPIPYAGHSHSRRVAPRLQKGAVLPFSETGLTVGCFNAFKSVRSELVVGVRFFICTYAPWSGKVELIEILRQRGRTECHNHGQLDERVVEHMDAKRCDEPATPVKDGLNPNIQDESRQQKQQRCVGVGRVSTSCGGEITLPGRQRSVIFRHTA